VFRRHYRSQQSLRRCGQRITVSMQSAMIPWSNCSYCRADRPTSGSLSPLRWGVSSRTVLPNGHPKFIVFRRDVASSISDRAEVRIVAKIAREFSAEVAGKKPGDGEDAWVIRNVAFPFRSSPVNDNPEMYELHSEDPALELTPGRYALVLKSQAYDFSVEGKTVDPKQCIERIVATNGTYYSDRKKP
jgi:hypothetical protein